MKEYIFTLNLEIKKKKVPSTYKNCVFSTQENGVQIKKKKDMYQAAFPFFSKAFLWAHILIRLTLSLDIDKEVKISITVSVMPEYL